MSAPIIGITTARTRNQAGHLQISLMEAYVKAIGRGGAVPVMIPVGLVETALQNLLPHLQGVLFTGGGDIHPDQYGGEGHPLVDDVDVDRDRTEVALLRLVLQAGLPFLGICRGLQIINVGLGGTLYEDIQAQHPGASRHQFKDEFARNHLAHGVEIEPGSRLAQIAGSPAVRVNSLHHQGIRQLAPGLCAAALAPDGIVEAIEMPAYPFGLAVQWHPEWLPDERASVALFQEFARAAAAAPAEPPTGQV